VTINQSISCKIAGDSCTGDLRNEDLSFRRDAMGNISGDWHSARIARPIAACFVERSGHPIQQLDISNDTTRKRRKATSSMMVKFASPMRYDV
jgi:hypothetical protein